jgi:hypothetical protein
VGVEGRIVGGIESHSKGVLMLLMNNQIKGKITNSRERIIITARRALKSRSRVWNRMDICFMG